MSNTLTENSNSNVISVDSQSESALSFLREAGLPTENIIAPTDERQIVGHNLPAYLDKLSREVKQDARYLSKFVIGAATGLFDYSLNAIWNEVVLALRKKAITYGIDIFFDSAVSGKNREFYSKDDDLVYLKDAVLLDTCKKLELISETTFRKLKYILDMRNDIGISHPTDYSITAYELLSWLQTCINDVLKDQPTEAALQVQQFITNLKKYAEPLNETDKEIIKRGLVKLPVYHLGNILKTIFSIYISEDTNIDVRKNILSLAPDIWNNSLDEVKYKLGITLAGYSTNLHKEKYKLGEQFFSIVDGNNYRTIEERVILVDSILDELFSKHNGWDNFHNEAPVAANLSSYIQESKDITPNNINKLVKVILSCRIGKGVSYCNGVSPRAKEYYDDILSKLGDKYTPYVISALKDYEIKVKLDKDICRQQLKEALIIIKQSVIAPRLIDSLNYLIERIESNGSCMLDKEFKILFSPFKVE